MVEHRISKAEEAGEEAIHYTRFGEQVWSQVKLKGQSEVSCEKQREKMLKMLLTLQRRWLLGAWGH